MAKKGIFRKLATRITAPITKTFTAVTDVTKRAGSAVAETVKAPFVKKTKSAKPKPKTTKPAVAPRPKVNLTRTTPKPKRSKPRPTPAVAREQLMEKLQDMYWLQKKWDAATMSRRINKMTDEQVYAALDLTENQVETVVRQSTPAPQWAAPDDPTSNVLWYHGEAGL
jgi:hypothetical protein